MTVLKRVITLFWVTLFRSETGHFHNFPTLFQDLINLVQLDNILTSDFNAEPEEENMLDFLNIYNLKNLLKQKTCNKNLDNLSCIDLILTNCHRGFRNDNMCSKQDFPIFIK